MQIIARESRRAGSVCTAPRDASRCPSLDHVLEVFQDVKVTPEIE